MIQFSSVQFDLTQIPYIVIRSETEKPRTQDRTWKHRNYTETTTTTTTTTRRDQKERKIEKKEEENGIKSKGEKQQGSAKIA